MSEGKVPDETPIADLKIDLIRRGGRRILVTATEFKLLELLGATPGTRSDRAGISGARVTTM